MPKEMFFDDPRNTCSGAALPHHWGQAPAALLAVLERPRPWCCGCPCREKLPQISSWEQWPFEIFSFYIKTMRICHWLHVSRCPQQAEGCGHYLLWPEWKWQSSLLLHCIEKLGFFSGSNYLPLTLKLLPFAVHFS